MRIWRWRFGDGDLVTYLVTHLKRCEISDISLSLSTQFIEVINTVHRAQQPRKGCICRIVEKWVSLINKTKINVYTERNYHHFGIGLCWLWHTLWHTLCHSLTLSHFLSSLLSSHSSPKTAFRNNSDNLCSGHYSHQEENRFLIERSRNEYRRWGKTHLPEKPHPSIQMFPVL